MPQPHFTTLPEAVQAFRPNCPGCSPQKLALEAALPCSAFDCPGLPDELKVTCDTCMYDFAHQDGQIKCDHATCETAQVLKANVATYQTWLEHISG